MLMTCKLKLLVLLMISFVVRMIAITRKKTKKIAAILIRRAIPVTPNKDAKVQEDLSSTTPTQVPIGNN